MSRKGKEVQQLLQTKPLCQGTQKQQKGSERHKQQHQAYQYRPDRNGELFIDILNMDKGDD